MKIAFLGTRGIPASYSGFETFVEELGKRLVLKGHEVTVYNRSHHISYKNKTYQGIRLVRLPTIRSKHFDTIFHTFLSVLHGLFKRYDIIYFCGVGNSLLTILPRIAGTKVILNVDGADWERDKWHGFAKTFLRWSEKIATIFPSTVIADSRAIQKRYGELYHKETVFIPYGANIIEDWSDNYLNSLSLKKDKYILFVGRLVPENEAHILIKAFRQIDTDIKLVIVGDAPYSEDYKEELKTLSKENDNIIFTGYIFGDGYKSLSSNALFFVLPSGIDGTRPVLLDQMGFGNCVLVRNTEANMEVIGDAGICFDKNNPVEDLKNKIIVLLKNPEVIISCRLKTQKRISEIYSWEKITLEYLQLFDSMRSKHKEVKR